MSRSSERSWSAAARRAFSASPRTLRNSSAWSSTESGSELGTICTTGATRVLTSTVPWRSTTSPRGASIRTLRTRLSRACET
jgi:hypothetical protein